MTSKIRRAIRNQSDIDFTDSALENIEETGCDPLADLARLCAGEVTAQGLLALCMDGADEDRRDGWTDYVQALKEAAS